MLGFKKRTASGSVSAERARVGRSVGERLAATPGAEPAIIGHAQAFVFPDFLDRAACQTLVDMIESDRRPSTILTDRNGYDVGFRTSDSCDMDRYDPRVAAADARIADLLGIPHQFGETIQGQRYAPGQHFRAHHDFFHETQSYWADMKACGGQRTWTAMVYLNDVEEGGATWFPQAGLRVAPRRGLLLAWNNMNPDGSPNMLTLHEGMPVVTGVKYIITKWFRERPWTAIAA